MKTIWIYGANTLSKNMFIKKWINKWNKSIHFVPSSGLGLTQYNHEKWVVVNEDLIKGVSTMFHIVSALHGLSTKPEYTSSFHKDAECLIVMGKMAPPLHFLPSFQCVLELKDENFSHYEKQLNQFMNK